MNENLNLCEILKDCPKGTKLYCTIFGDVEFDRIDLGCKHPITINICKSEISELFTQDGRLYDKYDGECTLFPSKDQRDWGKFTAPWYKKDKFDPKTLKPFDKVLVKDSILVEDSLSSLWIGQILSFIKEDEGYPYGCISEAFRFCIPYNDETKHLIGTKDEAPAFYRYWEE